MLFEFDKYDRAFHRSQPARPDAPYAVATGVQAMSLLYWAEHCVECAAPSCYQSCDLYQPRLDTRCRRFTFGAYKNRGFSSSRGYGVEVSFNKWAKMIAYGNLRLHSPARVRATEKFLSSAASAANLFGSAMARITRKPRWKALTHVAFEEFIRRGRSMPSAQFTPDAFLLELYNPTSEVIRIQLSFSPLDDEAHSVNSLVRISQTVFSTLVCPPGYSRHETPFAQLTPLIASGPFIISLVPEADSGARLVFLTANFVKFSAPVPTPIPSHQQAKCLVFDLDNTLWNGILVEGDDVAVSPETIRLIKHLDERGILLSIASKNDPDLVWKKLEQLGLAEYFLVPQISWNPKSQAMQAIAERLNIGIDSLAFIDDNPFELDQVAQAHPQVLCLNASQLPSLFSDPRFQGGATADARRRRLSYHDAAARESSQQSFGSDLLGFLASCEISLQISPYSESDSDRVAELVQRTNQLNFSGCKYTRAELNEILQDSALEKFVLKVHDRYGLYGTVGFCIAERLTNAVVVRDFMLSCRVQGKLIEQSFFHHLLDRHNPESASALWINFRPTARNNPARQVLEALGFRACSPDSSSFPHGMLLSSSEFPSLRSNIVRVDCCYPAVSSSSPDAEVHRTIVPDLLVSAPCAVKPEPHSH